MLDLTYIFPEEPLEDDSPFVMGIFPHPRFTTWLHDVLLGYGLKWGMQASVILHNGQGALCTHPNGHDNPATYSIGCQLMNMHDSRDMGIVLHTEFQKNLSVWRFYDRSYRVALTRSSSKLNTIWLTLSITNRWDHKSNHNLYI